MYNFDNLPQRRNTNSIKWDYIDDVLPMWVADMDFEAPDFIINAIQKRLDNKVFGYSDVPNSFYESIKNFWKRRHNLNIKNEEIIFTTGVVPAISSMVKKLTTPAENVVVLSPVYNIFYNSIINAGRKVLASELIYKNQNYEIDFKDLEEKLKNPDTTLMIFCNPHNPIGKIWTKEELTKVSNLAKKYGVIIISDEIHCDIVKPGLKYVPFLSVDEDVIMCISASKCFNLAGLQGASVVIKNKFLYNKVHRCLNSDEVAEGNAFVFSAMESAFNNGDLWLDELNEYIQNNKIYAQNFIENEIKELKTTNSNATYLIWVSIKELTNDSKAFVNFLIKEAKLFVSAGYVYGQGGEGFIRINLATSLKNVMLGMQKLKEGVIKFKEIN